MREAQLSRRGGADMVIRGYETAASVTTMHNAPRPIYWRWQKGLKSLARKKIILKLKRISPLRDQIASKLACLLQHYTYCPPHQILV